MTGYRKSGGSNVALTTRFRKSGGANVALTIAKRRLSGAWVDVISFLSAAPNPCDGQASGMTLSGSVTSASCVVTGFSGACAWTYVSGATLSISSTTATTVSWQATVTGAIPKTAVWRVTNAGNTYDVAITLTWYDLR